MEEDIIEMRRAGYSLDELAEEFAYLSRREINAILEKYGLN